MESITIKTKTNGYRAEGLQDLIHKFEKAAAKLFPGCTVSHFYYGDHVDMADLGVRPGDYAHFNIYADRVSLNGYAGSHEDVTKWESMTYRDELYDGRLLELAESN